MDSTKIQSKIKENTVSKLLDNRVSSKIQDAGSSVDTYTREYYEQDGTRVLETVTLTRIPPKSGEFVGTNILDCDPDFFNQALTLTNELRAKHQAPPLKMNTDLSKFAQEWADHLAKINKCIHRDPNKYGENLYYKYHYSKILLNGRDPIQSWYDEIENYYPYFGKDPPKALFPKVGHFTNLVWKETKRMGIGYAKGTNTVYVVCNYDPAGNLFTAFKDNVLPAITVPALKFKLNKMPRTAKTTKYHSPLNESKDESDKSLKEIAKVAPDLFTKTAKGARSMFNVKTKDEMSNVEDKTQAVDPGIKSKKEPKRKKEDTTGKTNEDVKDEKWSKKLMDKEKEVLMKVGKENKIGGTKIKTKKDNKISGLDECFQSEKPTKKNL